MDYSKTVTLENTVYTINMMGSEQQLDLFWDLVTMAGPSLGALLTSEKKEDENIDVGKVLKEALGSLNQYADKKKVKEFVKCCLNTVYVNGNESVMNKYATHFQGKLGLQLMLAGEVVSFNLGPSLRGVVKRLVDLLPKKAAAM